MPVVIGFRYSEHVYSRSSSLQVAFPTNSPPRLSDDYRALIEACTLDPKVSMVSFGGARNFHLGRGYSPVGLGSGDELLHWSPGAKVR